MKPTPSDTLDADTAKQVLNADLSNLLRKVKSGKPLTRWERNLVEASGHTGGRTQTTFAANQSELAAIFQTNRQRISYYARQPDAPRPREDGRLDVAAWRRFLTERGRLTASTSNSAPGSPLTFCDGLEAAHERVTDKLPRTMELALLAAHVVTTPKQLESAVAVLRLFITAQADDLLRKHGGEPLLPDASAPWLGTDEA